MWLPARLFNSAVFTGGRGQETPGEDPILTSKYAEFFVRGMQGMPMSSSSPSSKYLKTSACIKHFAAYSQEAERKTVAANVSVQDMNDTYLVAFEAGVRKGRASGLM
jgi:beta-glucosidase-like glycosyl hydrolase